MDETWDQAWRRVRSRRALLWGHAAQDPHRRAVYVAALEQAEQFGLAAHNVGPTTKPVLLFYALSQACRAIAADLAEDEWAIERHGASIPNDVPGDHVFDTIFRASPPATGKHDTGCFTVVARATGSPVPVGPITVSELWQSLPELSAGMWRLGIGISSRVLRFQEETAGSGGDTREFLKAHATHASFGWVPGDLAGTLAEYPSASGFEIKDVEKFSGTTTVVVWPDPSNETYGAKPLHEVGVHWNGAYYLTPPLGENRATPSLLMMWWALMLALSSLARYHPARWRSALDPDSSLIATALEEMLLTAELRIPQLISDALATPENKIMAERMAAHTSGEASVPPTDEPGENGS